MGELRNKKNVDNVLPLKKTRKPRNKPVLYVETTNDYLKIIILFYFVIGLFYFVLLFDGKNLDYLVSFQLCSTLKKKFPDLKRFILKSNRPKSKVKIKNKIVKKDGRRGTFTYIEKFQSLLELDNFIRLKYQAMSTKHSQIVGCTLCKYRCDHKMKQSYRQCFCNNSKCDLQLVYIYINSFKIENKSNV